MRTITKLASLGLLLISAGNYSVATWASKVADTLRGTITSVIGHEIAIDGKPYLVESSPTTDRVLWTLKQGQLVEVTLDAPPSKKEARVTGITVVTSTEE